MDDLKQTLNMSINDVTSKKKSGAPDEMEGELQ